MVLLQLDPFLNELTSMFERSTEKGSVWVTLKRSSLKSKVQRNKLASAGETIEYRCLIRATDGKKTISTSEDNYTKRHSVKLKRSKAIRLLWLDKKITSAFNLPMQLY
ncbi:signal recognition particle 14 kDa protein-like isoform X2 [Prosopis cineraria]|uniref:signal recognition particle 14 kDa protein-like isoform X2 n=1 Tax=Prosopis cineraria TaxID=364024 RepID=UPI0024109DE3|nr:signal recognition particle 14 kDa protein-like isoform X2 [Prosopis cineraria]